MEKYNSKETYRRLPSDVKRYAEEILSNPKAFKDIVVSKGFSETRAEQMRRALVRSSKKPKVSVRKTEGHFLRELRDE